ncbi:MAG: ABC transporter permease [Chloroflexi bacterium]|nr:ABC transporter permease [Chloroflexota bacterium]
MRFALAILRKELRDTLRDRRTLISMIIMPVLLMPALILGIGWFAEMQSRESQEKEMKLGIVNGPAAVELVTYVASHDKTAIIEIGAEPEKAVRDGKVDLAISIPANWHEMVKSHAPVTLTVLYNSTKSDTSVMLARLNAVLKQYIDTLVDIRMRENGLDMSILVTPTPVLQDVATSQERGGSMLGFLLPMFLVLWAITGGMYTAIDISAGEKERKTLEPLLTTPVSRLDIVLGKLSAVSVTSLTSITLALASLYAGIAWFGNAGILGPQTGADAVNLTVAPGGLAIMFAVGILLAIMFAAIELGLSIFAKSYREAQSYLTPMYLAAFLPIVVVNIMTSLEPNTAIFLIPAVNAVLLFKEVLLGTLNAAHILVSLGSLVIFAAIAVGVSVRIYTREGVLFRT